MCRCSVVCLFSPVLCLKNSHFVRSWLRASLFRPSVGGKLMGMAICPWLAFLGCCFANTFPQLCVFFLSGDVLKNSRLVRSWFRVSIRVSIFPTHFRK